MADRGWQREFDDPIPLPDGTELVMLKDVSGSPPRKEQDQRQWTGICWGRPWKCVTGSAVTNPER
jgi:hypothetical protein